MSRRVSDVYLRLQKRLKDQSNIFHFFQIDNISDRKLDDAIAWCEINTKGCWGLLINQSDIAFHFEFKTDAALFALFIK